MQERVFHSPLEPPRAYAKQQPAPGVEQEGGDNHEGIEMRNFLVLLLLISTTGCSDINLGQYRELKPEFNLFEYFQGKTRGWGIVQDRSGNLTRHFVVSIDGRLNSAGELILDEKFTWNDGSKSTRIWTLKADGSRTYTGTAEDVVGSARGESSGNVLNLRYVLRVPVNNRIWDLTLDDWMFLLPDQVLLNRTTMKKFGLRVGEVTIAFSKPTANHRG